jgi:hypothetical protein
MNTTHTALLFLVLAAGMAGCDSYSLPTPIVPSTVSSPPTPSMPPDLAHFMADAVLSGVVYELTPGGRVPVEGAGVYCEMCGEATHSWAETDASGFYSFTGVWDNHDFPMRIWIGKAGYADPAGLPQPTPPNPAGAGWREVMVKGDTQLDIELVRQ